MTDHPYKVEIALPSGTVQIPINTRLAFLIEDECGEESFLDPITRMIPTGDKGQHKVAIRDAITVVRAGLRGIGMDPAIVDDLKPLETLNAAGKIVGGILEGLAKPNPPEASEKKADLASPSGA
jgi:predicted component of type VI protein secretion system